MQLKGLWQCSSCDTQEPSVIRPMSHVPALAASLCAAGVKSHHTELPPWGEGAFMLQLLSLHPMATTSTPNGSALTSKHLKQVLREEKRAPESPLSPFTTCP